MPRGSVTTDLAPPLGGARSDDTPERLPAATVPADATLNVIIREGKLVNRPGMTPVTPNKVTGRPMGGILVKFPSGQESIVGTTKGWYRLDTSVSPAVWTDLTGGVPLSGTADDPVRFAIFVRGGVMRLIGVNGYSDNPKTIAGGGANYTDLGGGPPPARDIATANNRVILVDTFEGGVGNPYRIRFSDFNTDIVWPGLNVIDIPDTPDVLSGCEALSRTSVAVYKEESQWILQGQSGLFPFKIELQDQKPGPAGPAAKIAVDGLHYYLALDASIYTFDGIRGRHIGEPIRRYLVRHINFDKIRRSFTVYAKRDRQIWFFFPQGGATDVFAAISYDIDSDRFFPHEFRLRLSSGFQWLLQAPVTWDDLLPFTWDNVAATYPTWDSFGTESVPVDLLGGIDGTMHRFGIAAMDSGFPPQARWRYGPLPLAGLGKRVRAQSLDTFFERTSVGQTVITRWGTTDTLASEPIFPPELTDTFDMSVDASRQARYDPDLPGIGSGTGEARYAAIEHVISTRSDWKWHGAVARTYPLETGNV